VNLLRNGPTAVLMYHSIATRRRDPHELAVSPDHFAAQIEHLTGRAEVVPFRDVLRPAPGPRVAITFDDGYADNLHVAKPVLAAAAAPATVFIATDNVTDRTREFWSNRIEHVILDAPDRCAVLELEVEGRRVRVDVRTPEGRARALVVVHRMLRRRPLPEIETALRTVAEQMGSGEQLCAEHCMMTDDEVRALVSDGLIEVGGHTRSHVMLSAVPAAEQRREIGEGRAVLESIVDRPVMSFAYPFGAWGEYNRASVNAVRDAGYEAACTTRTGLVSPVFGRFRIPRFMVLDWDADTFAAALEHWFKGRRAPQSY